MNFRTIVVNANTYEEACLIADDLRDANTKIWGVRFRSPGKWIIIIEDVA